MDGADPSYNTFKELSDAILKQNTTIGSISTDINGIKNTLNSKADKSELFSKDYNDLTNTPEIPSIEGLATQTWVEQQIQAIPEVDLSAYALRTDIPDVSKYVEKVEGMGLSSNDYTSSDKLKLQSLNNYDDTEVRSELSRIGEITSKVYTLIDNTLFSSENILDSFDDISSAEDFIVSLYNSYVIAIEHIRGTFVNVYSKTIQDSEDINQVRTINVTLLARVSSSQDLKLILHLVDADNIFTLTKEYIDISTGGSTNNYIMLE